MLKWFFPGLGLVRIPIKKHEALAHPTSCRSNRTLNSWRAAGLLWHRVCGQVIGCLALTSCIHARTRPADLLARAKHASSLRGLVLRGDNVRCRSIRLIADSASWPSCMDGRTSSLERRQIALRHGMPGSGAKYSTCDPHGNADCCHARRSRLVLKLRHWPGRFHLQMRLGSRSCSRSNLYVIRS
jgi:hypothetical protein